MEYVVGITVVVVVLPVAVIWWLLNRRRASQGAAGAGLAESATPEEGAKDTEPSGRALSHGSLAGPSAKAAGTSGIPTVAGFGSPSASAPPPTPEAEHDAAVAHSAAAAPAQAQAQTPNQAPAETNGMTPGSTPGPVPPVEPDREPPMRPGDDAPDARATGDRAEWETQWTDAAGKPTSPPSGKAGDPSGPRSAVPADTGPAAAGTSSTSGVKRAPAGHLSAKEPYGAGSASPGPDGSGPDGFTVKGDASAMIYYDESEAGYQEAACDVWFLSPAHAEAAGFREPRRIRR